ncbi:SRPBCC family protein [Umezawaea beigongshangensis]|uniref:SRPBCC family protein n=1 Tax=Umezawaea beigongshangensis TaxID=2780383 RepID=UPI0018F1AF46|nr:SRPBCC family protein [Umezawaea beigongshangensis]
MSRTHVSSVVPVSAEEVWDLLRDFGGLPGWHPLVAATTLVSGTATGVGAIRRVTMGDGSEVVERLVSLDDASRTGSYELVEHAFPVRRAVCGFRVVPVTDSGHAFVEMWADSDLDAEHEEEVGGFVTALFTAALSGLRDRVPAAV